MRVLCPRLFLAAAIMLTLVPCAGWGQSPSDTPVDIMVNIFVNYGFAYRQGTWVPVNVLVKNDKEDFSGWVEIRTYGIDDLESPIYRVPADCPKGSNKRFQLHCYLDAATRIEVQLYDIGKRGRERRMLEFPSWMTVKPIETGDVMALALDEEGTGLGFLHEAVNLDTGGGLRFHRETLRTAELPSLARYPQSYAAFDVIVLGDTDPGRIPQRVRDLLYNYVRGGGTLAVLTGEHADKYRGTWVEELLGIAIGKKEAVNEAALAGAAFAPEDVDGAKDFRDCIVAELTPELPDVKRSGIGRTLATRHSIGSGHAYAIAVDADSHALQDCRGYLKLWNEIATRREARAKLNFEAATSFAANNLPRISGVVIHSKASVMAYLALYFCVGIVGNWLFFSWLKRREWAWAMLIVFSAGFTAYAVVFGTAGRARTSELHQIEILHVPKGGGLSEARAMVGLLTARSKWHAMDLEREFSLARDIEESFDYAWRRRNTMRSGRQPFYLVQDRESRVERFRVGASEMRLIQVETEEFVPGGVDGQIEMLDDETVRVDLVNNTGFTLKEAKLYLDGQWFALKPDGNRYVADLRGYSQRKGILGPEAPIDRDVYSRGLYGRGGPRLGSTSADGRATAIEQFRKRALGVFRKDLPNVLLSKEHLERYAEGVSLDQELGPFLVGWADGSALGTASTREETEEATGETLLIADIDAKRAPKMRYAWRDLLAFPDPEASTPTHEWGLTSLTSSFVFRGKDTPRVYIGIPQDVLDRDPCELIVKLNASSLHGEEVVFAPEGAPDDWPAKHKLEEPGPEDGRSSYRRRGGERAFYEIDNWKDRLVDWDETAGKALAEFQAAHKQLSRNVGRNWPAAEEDSSAEFARPVRLLTCVVRRADGPDTTPRGNQPVNEVRISARVRISADRPDYGEETQWQ